MTQIPNQNTRAGIAGMLGTAATYAAVIAAGITLVVLVIGGFYQVRPGEAAAEQTFGAARTEPVTQEGLHWHWPWPIGRTTVLEVQRSRTTEVGFNTLPDNQLDLVTQENWQRDYEAATMITGDLGLLEIQMVAHYFISDLNKYLFNADDPGHSFEYLDDNDIGLHVSNQPGRPDGQTIKDALEIAVRRAVGQRTMDQVLVSEREVIEQETLEKAQAILDAYQTGLTITSVQMQEIKPPDEVQQAFDDVLKAREERDTRINEALAFESKVLPEARGQAERIRKEAVAYHAQRVNQAEAEANRFLAIVEEYRRNPEIISRRMYLQTMDLVLPHTEKTLLVGTGTASSLIINAGEGGGAQPLPVTAPDSAP